MWLFQEAKSWGAWRGHGGEGGALQSLGGADGGRELTIKWISFSANLLKLIRRNYAFRHNVGTASLQSRSINATLQRIAGLTRNMLLLVKNMIFAHKICCCWLITWSLLRVWGMDWLLEVRLSSLVLESHGVQSQAHISLTPSSSSSPPSGPRSEVVVWELEEDSSRFSFE